MAQYLMGSKYREIGNSGILICEVAKKDPKIQQIEQAAKQQIEKKKKEAQQKRTEIDKTTIGDKAERKTRIKTQKDADLENIKKRAQTDKERVKPTEKTESILDTTQFVLPLERVIQYYEEALK